jgi:hypothetical protein
VTHKTAPGIKVHITKREIERQLAALSGGNPLTPNDPQLGWTGNDMLALAGMCLLKVMSQGPKAWAADERTFKRDLCGAVLVYARFAALVALEEFEAECGNHVLAVAEATSEGPDVRMTVVSSGKLQDRAVSLTFH